MANTLARAASMLNRFACTAGDWGFPAAWAAVVSARFPGRRSHSLAKPKMQFHYRGAVDRGMLGWMSEPHGYIVTQNGPPIRNIIDAGANIGAFSVFAKRIYPEARIAALEIEDSNFAILKANLDQLPGARAMHAALWSEDGAIRFVRGGSTTDHSVSLESGDLPARSVRSLIDEMGADTLDILKMDIEGAEADVIESLDADTLSRINAIIFECNDNDKPGVALRVTNALPTDEFDGFSFGENLYLIRRSTGWGFRRRPSTAGCIPS